MFVKVALLSYCHVVAFGLRHNLDAFIFYNGPGGPAAEFKDIRYWVNIMKTVDFVAQTSIGDAILVRTHSYYQPSVCSHATQIYRCYMVYARRWYMILFPLLLWLATLGTLLSLSDRTSTDAHPSGWHRHGMDRSQHRRERPAQRPTNHTMVGHHHRLHACCERARHLYAPPLPHRMPRMCSRTL